MRITDIQIYKLELPTDQWMLLSVETDEGYCGWGEITGSCDDLGIAGVLWEVRQALLGKNPLHIQECDKLLSRWTYPVLRNIRTYASALSGLDQALWDVTAKHYKMPLYKLYGGDGKKEIPLYANLNKALWRERSPEILARNGALAKKAGFQMVKCTPFDEIHPLDSEISLEKALNRMEALAEEVPIEKIAVDCHQRFGRYSLGRMVEEVTRRFGIPYWIEDPVDVLDYDTMRLMNQKYPYIRWAAGEDALNMKQILTTMYSGCYEILMPDIKYIGGPSLIKALVPAAEGYGCQVTMHNPNGIIATAHSAHVSALCESALPMEYPFAAVADRELLAVPQEIVREGSYVFSDEPGIGVEISRDAMKEFGFHYRDGRFERI